MFAILNTPEIVLILAVCLILFGSKKLPELARGLGQGIREFKKATRETTEELCRAIEESPPSETKQVPRSVATTNPDPASGATETQQRAG
jgi:TatA/E family protein of Tat protein translocase